MWGLFALIMLQWIEEREVLPSPLMAIQVFCGVSGYWLSFRDSITCSLIPLETHFSKKKSIFFVGFLFLWIALPILGSGFSRVWRVSAFDFLSPWVCLSFSEKLGLKLILGSRQNKAFYLVFVVLVFVGEMVSWVVCFSVSQTKISWFYTNWIVGEVWCLRFQIPCVVRVLVVKELKLKLLYRLMWGDKLKPFSVCC